MIKGREFDLSVVLDRYTFLKKQFSKNTKLIFAQNVRTN